MAKRKLGLLGMLGIGLVASVFGCNSVPVRQNVQEPVPACSGLVQEDGKDACLQEACEEKKENENQNPRYSGKIVYEIKKNYMALAGFKIGKGPVNQTLIEGTRNGFLNEGGSMTVFGWNDVDFGDGEVHETDVGVRYDQKVNDNLSVRLGAQHWFYPSRYIAPKDDDIIDVGFTVSNAFNVGVDADIGILYLFSNSFHGDGTNLYWNVSRTIPLGESQFYVRPGVKGALVSHFYGANGGYVTPEVFVGCKDEKRKTSLEAGASYQIPYGSNFFVEEPYWTVRAEKKF